MRFSSIDYILFSILIGGDSQSSLVKERKRQYKKELEDQIKEREATKERLSGTFLYIV